MTESGEQVADMVDHEVGQAGVPPSESSPGEQSELDLGVVATGHAGVDAALAGLDGLTDRPVGEHPDVFEQVHRGLHDAMSGLYDDSDAGPDEVGGPAER